MFADGTSMYIVNYNVLCFLYLYVIFFMQIFPAIHLAFFARDSDTLFHLTTFQTGKQKMSIFYIEIKQSYEDPTKKEKKNGLNNWTGKFLEYKTHAQKSVNTCQYKQ